MSGFPTFISLAILTDDWLSSFLDRWSDPITPTVVLP
jgi:hypothetical protein